MLLFQLVQTLSEEELERLGTITLTPPELKLLQYCIGIKDKKLFAPTPALSKLQFTATHLYKLTSVVLTKVLVHLYGDDFHAQISGLSKKVKLVTVIRHLMKIRERLLLKQKNRDALLAFYETCLEFENTTYSSDYNSKLVAGHYKKCLQYAGKKADAAYIFKLQVDTMAAEVNVMGAKGLFTNKKVRDAYQQKFDDMYIVGEKHKLYNLTIRALLINALFYFDLTKPEFALDYVGKAIALVNKYGDKISDKYKVEVSLYNCRALYFLSRFDESRKGYEAMDVISKMYGGGVINADIAKFIQVCLVTGHYARAKELLDKGFARIMDVQNSAGVMARLHLVKYLIYTAQYKQALQQLDNMEALVRNIKALQYTVEFRMLYTIAKQLSGNSDEAYNSAERALKFLYAKQEPEQLADFIEGFQLLKAFAKGANLNTRLQGILDKYQFNAYMQYGQLFNRINASN